MQRIFFAIATFLSSVCLNYGAVNLPTDSLTNTVHAGADSFFSVTLNGVPAGYDVGNNVYLGWCIDLYNTNNPSVGNVIHQGRLASSLSPAGALLPPATWSKINYILNHKMSTAADVQVAIWNYTDFINPDAFPNPAALDIIADADANAGGFVPGANDVVAALVIWQGAETNLQRMIIEVPPPTSSECSDRFTAGGFISKNGKKATFGIQGGYQNGRLWGGINYIDHGTGMHVHGRTCTSYTVVDTDCRRATYNVTINGRLGTATVRVCDYGEPGRNDVVEIALSNGYTAGIATTLGGEGKGGGNVQLHKPQCGTRARSPRQPR